VRWQQDRKTRCYLNRSIKAYARKGQWYEGATFWENFLVQSSLPGNLRCSASLHGEKCVIFMPWPLSRHCSRMSARARARLKFSRGICSHKKKKGKRKEKKKYPPKGFAAREPPTGYRKVSEFPPRTDIYFALLIEIYAWYAFGRVALGIRDQDRLSAREIAACQAQTSDFKDLHFVWATCDLAEIR